MITSRLHSATSQGEQHVSYLVSSTRVRYRDSVGGGWDISYFVQPRRQIDAVLLSGRPRSVVLLASSFVEQMCMYMVSGCCRRDVYPDFVFSLWDAALCIEGVATLNLNCRQSHKLWHLQLDEATYAHVLQIDDLLWLWFMTPIWIATMHSSHHSNRLYFGVFGWVYYRSKHDSPVDCNGQPMGSKVFDPSVGTELALHLVECCILPEISVKLAWWENNLFLSVRFWLVGEQLTHTSHGLIYRTEIWCGDWEA